MGLSNWHWYWLRVTQPVLSGRSGSGSGGNRHVYGLLEGLDPVGRRLLIRFDLVEDSQDRRFARVKVKSVVDKQGAGLASGQQCFLDLFENSQIGRPEQLVVYYLGSSDTAPVRDCLGQLLQEQQRQPGKGQVSDDTARIRYRLFGGQTQQSQTHNCLTWLRYQVTALQAHYANKQAESDSPSPIHLNLQLPPRAWTERLMADPQSVLPSGPTFFAKSLPANVAVVVTQDWPQAQPAVTGTPNFSRP